MRYWFYYSIFESIGFSRDGFSRSGSGRCSGNTWGKRHVLCSLFPVPSRIPPPHKKNFCGNLTSGGPAGRLASLDSDLFPVPCSLFPQDPTERTCVPYSLFPLSLRENPSLGFSFQFDRICQLEMICIGGVPVSKRHFGGAGP